MREEKPILVQFKLKLNEGATIPAVVREDNDETSAEKWDRVNKSHPRAPRVMLQCTGATLPDLPKLLTYGGQVLANATKQVRIGSEGRHVLLTFTFSKEGSFFASRPRKEELASSGMRVLDEFARRRWGTVLVTDLHDVISVLAVGDATSTKKLIVQEDSDALLWGIEVTRPEPAAKKAA